MFIELSITNFDFLTKFYEQFNFNNNLVLQCENLLEAIKKNRKKTEKKSLKKGFFMKIVIFWGKTALNRGLH